MATLPDIFCIYESDADAHLGTVRQIAQRFVDQGRVGEFVSLSPDESTRVLPGRIKNKDAVIILLTDQLNFKRREIKDLLDGLKNQYPDLIIAEVIIHHIRYDKDYISWPSDLAPIASRDDKDAAWSGIDSNLGTLIPVREKPSWKKYAKPIAAVVVLALLIWLLPKIFSNNEGPAFSLKVMDNRTGRMFTDTSACYLPCVAILSSQSENFDSLTWNISDTDTTIRMEKEYSYLFGIPGEHRIKLTVQDGKQKKTATRKLLVKAPLIADFEAGNDGCIAPCSIDFKNRSGKGSFQWKFDGINDSSTEENPRKKYDNPGEYNVTLTVVNEDNIQSDTIKKVTINRDNSPFADFSTRRVGRVALITRTVEFINASRNANDYIWDFGDGTPTSKAVSPTHTYAKSGTYAVRLIATQGEASDVENKEITVGMWRGADIHVQRAVEQNPQLKAQVRRLQETRVQTP